ncbi:MAG: L,D-transpeptidase [Magnetococcales bacterium]|nr:L,D-transpeptidase [Magnetococcales bacterium]
MGNWGRGLFLLCCLWMQAVLAETTAMPLVSRNYENERILLQAWQALQKNQLDEALEAMANLVRKEPDFRLAQLIYGDLLMAKATTIRRFGTNSNDRKELREELENLLDEAKARFSHLVNPPATDAIPQVLMQLPRENAFAIVVDLSKSRLYLFRNDTDRPRLILDFYVSAGKNGTQKYRKGDKRTPIGVYFINERFPKEKLPDFYGAGALPINYPNEWDRIHRRTGYGIWLHGTPTDTYSRPPRASDGCVALSNSDFQMLEELTGVGTPVIISEQVDWLSQKEWQETRKEFLDRLGQWTQWWQGRDVNSVLSSYAPDFRNQSRNLENWKREIRWVMTVKPERGGDLSEYTILGYPGPTPMMLVSYATTGKDTASGVVRRQLWRREAEKKEWRIIYEELG